MADVVSIEINKVEVGATLHELNQTNVRELFAMANMDHLKFLTVACNGEDRLVREFIAPGGLNRLEVVAILRELQLRAMARIVSSVTLIHPFKLILVRDE